MQCRYTKIAQRIFKYSDIQYTSLTPDKILNSFVDRTPLYVNIYGSYKLSKNSLVFGPPCIPPNIHQWYRSNIYCIFLLENIGFFSIFSICTIFMEFKNFFKCEFAQKWLSLCDLYRVTTAWVHCVCMGRTSSSHLRQDQRWLLWTQSTITNP